MKQEIMKNDDDSQKVLDANQLLERYLLETEKIREKFNPVFDRLKKEGMFPSMYGPSASPVKWYQEYDLPLFEAVKVAMKRVTGTDDYLELCENRFPERITTLILERQDELGIATENDKTNIVPHFSFFRDSISLLTLFSLATVHDNQEELTPGVFFRISDEELPSLSGGMAGGMGVGMGAVWSLTRFPPIVMAKAPYDHIHWNIMAIYSFKNERARKILLDFIVSDFDESETVMQVGHRSWTRGGLASYAASYLPFFPNSDELLPKVKALLQKEIDEEHENNPDRAKRFIDENGTLINPFRNYTDYYHQKIEGVDYSDWRKLTDSVPKIFRLAQLVRTLEFNEKIPTEERERFDIFRRELMISLLSQNPMSEKSPASIATLKKGDEHFEIYLVEYGGFPNLHTIQWEGAGDSYPYTLINPYWQKRKEFYEQELAFPRAIYTNNQIEYIRNRINKIKEMK